MELSLAEAARLLGKSERQLRYLVKTGKIRARKIEGRWRLARKDLPLSPGQARAEESKQRRAARIALEVLQPEGPSAEPRRRFSVRELAAYREGAPLYRSLAAELGPDHPAALSLREALMLLACGCHEYHASAKVAYYGRAREQVSRAVMGLLIEDGEGREGLAVRIEQSVLPALGGLIRQAERRGRRR